MTEENLELARGAIGDLRALFALFDEYIIWDHRSRPMMDKQDPSVGRQAVIRDLTKWVGTWDDFRFEVEELIDAGDSVLLVVHESGRGRGSGAPMEHRYCTVWTFRNGRIIRGEAYETKAEALEALGMDPAGRSADIEIACEYFAEMNRAFAGEGDLRAVISKYIHPDCVAELGVMEGNVVGHEGVTRYFEGQLAVIDDMRIDPEDFIEAGDRVVMPFRIHGRAKETGLPIEFRYAQLFTMRSGRFVHTRMYASRERALAAAGVAEAPPVPDDAELIRGMYERWNRNAGDFAFDLFDPEVEIHQTSDLFDTPATFQGHHGLIAAGAALLSSFRELQWHPRDWHRHGGWRIVGIRVTAVGRQSGAETEIDIAHAWRIRDGRITDFHAYPSVPEALEALGLERDARAQA